MLKSLAIKTTFTCMMQNTTNCQIINYLILVSGMRQSWPLSPTWSRTINIQIIIHLILVSGMRQSWSPSPTWNRTPSTVRSLIPLFFCQGWGNHDHLTYMKQDTINCPISYPLILVSGMRQSWPPSPTLSRTPSTVRSLIPLFFFQGEAIMTTFTYMKQDTINCPISYSLFLL
jgi:hypothetical protein